MKNSVISFTHSEWDNYSVNDYSTFNVKEVLDRLPDFNPVYFDWYQMDNNDKIERISHELYGTTDYWDILVLINGKDPLFHMVYDFDILEEIAQSSVEEYNKVFTTTQTLTDTHKEFLKGIFVEELKIENENRRPLKIIKPGRIQDFLRDAHKMGVFS